MANRFALVFEMEYYLAIKGELNPAVGKHMDMRALRSVKSASHRRQFMDSLGPEYHLKGKIFSLKLIVERKICLWVLSYYQIVSGGPDSLSWATTDSTNVPLASEC